jgi:hypothetical protein
VPSLLKTSFLPAAAAAICLSQAVVRAADPRVDSWLYSATRRYARIYPSDAAKAAGSAVTTWSRGATAQSTPSYAGIVQVSSSANWVYLRTTGLGTHVMGPWYGNLARTQDFPSFPTNAGVLVRIPRSPVIPATKTLTGNGPIGYFVDGVAAFDNRDAFSYSNSAGADVGDAGPAPGGGGGMPPPPGGGAPPPPGGGGAGGTASGDGVWNREAYANEGHTFDPAFAHQAAALHHYHANAPAVRYQLGDNVDFDAATKTYRERTSSPTAHSPIVAWLADGLPVYGPYGYSAPMNPAGGIRRMTSGYVRRDGANGTTNLAATGRVTLPAWAARAQKRNASLPSTLQGPAVGAAFPLGRYIEDYDYLGDLGKTQGVDFDLNEYNVRFCVTPEFPQGTYAYFLTIEADGTPRFPNMVGRSFFGAPSGGAVTAINEAVTEHIRASQASAISISATKAGGSVMLEWSSVEGATYKVDTSADGRTWTALAAGITSRGGDTTTYSSATVAAQYRVTLAALATYDTRADGGLSGVGNNAVTAAAVGSSGTARLINIATRAALGGAAGTPIAGFVLGGTGTKPVLVRAVGPGLASYGVTGALADARLSLVSNGVVLAGNDNWQVADAAAIAGAGAFALAPGSRDAALVTTLGGGAFSAPVASVDGGSGVTLLEVYDLASSPDGVKVVNASTRAFVGTGENVLIPGFVVGGSGSLRVLLRAVGPGLAEFGVAAALADPQITLYRGSTALATNDNWSSAADASEVAAVSVSVGAFQLATGSRDAAMLATLSPGTYSAVVSGVGNTTGTVLVEVYVVD